ncbi:MAG: hypothetical protein ACOYXT_28490 [Bacteroidota bacterium]
MKKVMFILLALFGTFAVVNAQDTTSTEGQNQQNEMQQEQDRVKIKSQDLPDPVKKALEGQDYRGWLVNAAYKTRSASTDPNQTGAYGQEIYVVELKNGAQTKTVRFDKDGKKIDE